MHLYSDAAPSPGFEPADWARPARACCWPTASPPWTTKSTPPASSSAGRWRASRSRTTASGCPCGAWRSTLRAALRWPWKARTPARRVSRGPHGCALPLQSGCVPPRWCAVGAVNQPRLSRAGRGERLGDFPRPVVRGARRHASPRSAPLRAPLPPPFLEDQPGSPFVGVEAGRGFGLSDERGGTCP